jgi:thiamine biosynthesis lipoprotein
MLDNSVRFSRISGGAFDVTIGSVVQVWRQARREKRLPDPEALKEARKKVGYTNIVLDPDAKTAMLKLPGMRIDFGGIAKGYAVDQALGVLKSRGITCALVIGGGDMAVGKSPPGKAGWQIRIKNPDPKTVDKPDYLVVHDTAVSTSGDTYQFIEVSGQHYSHIISPASGMGVSDAASITVIAAEGITADALSTALSVMSVADGMKMIAAVPGASAAMVRRSPDGFQRFSSTGFPRTAHFGGLPEAKRSPN